MRVEKERYLSCLRWCQPMSDPRKLLKQVRLSVVPFRPSLFRRNVVNKEKGLSFETAIIFLDDVIIVSHSRFIGLIIDIFHDLVWQWSVSAMGMGMSVISECINIRSMQNCNVTCTRNYCGAFKCLSAFASTMKYRYKGSLSHELEVILLEATFSLESYEGLLDASICILRKFQYLFSSHSLDKRIPKTSSSLVIVWLFFTNFETPINSRRFRQNK